MIDIHLFEQLVAFASCGTLSAAAEQLHISQPALSRAMQRLEDELGVRLFDRQKSRLFLNENGELAVTYARNLLLQESAMIEQIREFDRKKRTIFVGSCTPILLPDFVSLLSRIYEGMTISTEVNGDLERLKDGLRENVYQLAFQQKKPDEAEFYSFPVETERLYVYLPPAHPLADSVPPQMPRSMETHETNTPMIMRRAPMMAMTPSQLIDFTSVVCITCSFRYESVLRIRS